MQRNVKQTFRPLVHDDVTRDFCLALTTVVGVRSVIRSTKERQLRAELLHALSPALWCNRTTQCMKHDPLGGHHRQAYKTNENLKRAYE